MMKLKLNGARHPADGSDKPYYDKEKRAIVHGNVHLTPQNKKRLVEKEYHTFEVAALESDVGKIQENIALFHDHIRQEEERMVETKKLILSGKERDKHLLALLG